MKFRWVVCDKERFENVAEVVGYFVRRFWDLLDPLHKDAMTRDLQTFAINGYQRGAKNRCTTSSHARRSRIISSFNQDLRWGESPSNRSYGAYSPNRHPELGCQGFNFSLKALSSDLLTDIHMKPLSKNEFPTTMVVNTIKIQCLSNIKIFIPNLKKILSQNPSSSPSCTERPFLQDVTLRMVDPTCISNNLIDRINLHPGVLFIFLFMLNQYILF